MALTSGFFNSSNHDRQYNAEQMSSIFDGVIADGVFEQIGNKLFTVPGEGLQVVVQSGRAWFNHTWTYNDANYPLNLDPADASLPRIDTVVLEVNHNVSIRTNSIKVIKGTPNSNPTAPSIASATDPVLAQHRLADVRVNAGATKIEAGDITIKVGQTETPFVTGIIKVTDISQLYAQWGEQFSSKMETWENDFTEWFERLQTYLSEDVVTNLQLQIDQNKINIISNKIKADTLKMMGLAENGFNDDAFKAIWAVILLIQQGVATITVHLQNESGEPLIGWEVQGVKTSAGMAIKTNANGDADGVIPGDITTYVGIRGFVDIQDAGEQLTPKKGESLGTKTYVVRKISGGKKIYTSTTADILPISPLTNSITIVAIGGGGGGSNGSFASDNYYSSGGSGGMGGNIVTQTESSVTGKRLSVIIGSGGSAGAQGGNTTVSLDSSEVVRATGGTRGAAMSEASGAAIYDGDWSTPTIYAAKKRDATATYAASGGGGGLTVRFAQGNHVRTQPAASGGIGGNYSGNGGSGGGYDTEPVSSSSVLNGSSGSAPGGGGGGGGAVFKLVAEEVKTYGSKGTGGAGARGQVTITFNYV